MRKPEQWHIGTGLLVGAILGGVLGGILGEIPMLVLIGVALGGAVDMWLNPHTAEEG